MASLSITTTDGLLKSLDVEQLQDYTPVKGELMMFDGRVEDYQFEVKGSDVVLTLPNGEEFVLSGFADMLSEQDEESPTKLSIASGDEGEVLIIDSFASLTEIMDAAAAGDDSVGVEDNSRFSQGTIFDGNDNSQVTSNIDESTSIEERRSFSEFNFEDNNSTNTTTITETITGTTTSSSSTNNSFESDLGVSLDLTPPNSPTLNLSNDTGISNEDGIINDSTPTVSGTAEAGSTITLFVGSDIYVTTVDSDGTWSITVDELSDGDYSLSVTATDDAGNVSVATTLDITLDSSIDSITADIIDTSDSGVSNTDNITNDNTPTITGVTESGAMIVITDLEGNVIGTATADNEGNYSITTSELSDETHDFMITATDTAGNTTLTTQSVTIDTTTTSIPEITDIVDVNGDMSEIVLAGKGSESGNTITIYDQNDNVIGTTTVQEDGTWSFDISSLSNGSEYILSAKETDVAGNESEASQGVNTLQSDFNGTALVSGDDFVFTGSGNDAVRLSTDDANDKIVVDGGDGIDTAMFSNHTDGVTVDLSDNEAEIVGDDTVELRNIENVYGGKGADNITGDSNANTLFGDDGSDTLDGGAGNDVLAGGNGNDILLGGAGDDSLHGQNGDDTITGGAGNDTIRADGGTDTIVYSGNLSDYTITYNSSNGHIIIEDNRDGSPDGTDDTYGAEFVQFADVTVSTAIPSTGTIDLVASSDSGESNLDNLTNDTTPSIQVPLSTGVVVGYTITLYANGEKIGEHTVTQTDVSNGYVQAQANEITTDGEYSITATTTNLLGFEGRESRDIDITIDSTADADNNLSITVASSDEVANAQEAKSVSVELNGVDSDAQSVVVTFEDTDGTQVSVIATKNASGNWSVPDQDLSTLDDGEITVSATVTDLAGNTSTVNDTLSLDTTASDMDDLAITNIVDTNGDYSLVTMNGTGSEVGSIITIFDESGSSVGSAIVLENGTWSTNITNLSGTPINDNEFFKVSETDGAGNETAQTDSSQYWHGTWSNANTESTDDFIMAGSGNDVFHTDATLSGYNENGYVTSDNNDTNDKVVIDGGNGSDTVTFGKDFSEYSIGVNESGHFFITEKESSDSDGDGKGDVTELRNIETIQFNDTSYSNEDLLEVATPILDMNDITVETDESGSKTIILEDDMALNFKSLAEADLDNLNTIDMTGGEKGTTLENIEASDVLAMTESNETDAEIMKILGDETDEVKLDSSEWTKTDETISDSEGNEFDIYQGGDSAVTLYVDNDVLVTDI